MAAPRGKALTVFAILFALLGISNALKPMEASTTQGFVLFGHRLSGTPNLIAGPAFAVLLWAYAAGIWTLRRWALPLGVAYAAYVIANLIAFVMVAPDAPPLLFMLLYAVVAIGVSSGAAYLLYQRRDELA
ncbi:hypothetical protein K2Z84_09710 [Candidatus Binatia bacterium]|nr:hypothetical protein [Candidatus Binatia bacterium]